MDYYHSGYYMEMNHTFLICNNLVNKFKKLKDGYINLCIHSTFNNTINLYVNKHNNAYNTEHFEYRTKRIIAFSILRNTKTLAPFSINLQNLNNINFLNVDSVTLEKNKNFINLLIHEANFYTNFKINLDENIIEHNDKRYDLIIKDLSIKNKDMGYIANKNERKVFINNLSKYLQEYLEQCTDDFCIYKINKNKLDTYTCNLLDDIFTQKNYLKLDNLVGLGNGLTPAGDDFILGLKCFYDYFNKYIIDDDLRGLKATFKGIKNSLHKTNDISSDMLLLGFNGLYNSSAIDLLNLITQYQNDLNTDITEQLYNIQSYGHSSYYDFVCGFYFGLYYFSCAKFINTKIQK